ncbi:MAG: hypothetical protein KKC18_06665 [Chloroflexi bacterium]|nr:hypothetical protein [Chloroflexota bacterium]
MKAGAHLFAVALYAIMTGDDWEMFVGSVPMRELTPMPQTALKYDAEVIEEGRLNLHVPLPIGARVTVFVIEDFADSFDDLLAASQSSLCFWDNSFDDEDWNNA